jgi:hypothetical protein
MPEARPSSSSFGEDFSFLHVSEFKVEAVDPEP